MTSWFFFCHGSVNHGVLIYIGLFTAPTAYGEIIMIKTILVVGLLWGGVNSLVELKDSFQHINDSRQAAIEKATNY